MLPVLSVPDICTLVEKTGGLQAFFIACITELETQFARWEQFEKIPRVAMHGHQGVIELMPTSDGDQYSFKYVNGHPNNPSMGKLNVAAFGALADCKTGYPLMIAEMTLLTALRTAATSALAAKYLAKSTVKKIGIIGTGAQAEFQVLAQYALFPFESVSYFDIDLKAMRKFQKNLQEQPFKLLPCDCAEAVVDGVDIITTATASKSQAKILSDAWIKAGTHINGIGGDCPGKTELDQKILSRSKIVVEYLPQSKIEGEIQQTDRPIYAELWEIIAGKKPGRENNEEITLFDSVGFAIEDFTILKYVYALSRKYNIGTKIPLLPALSDVKDLFSVFAGS